MRFPIERRVHMNLKKKEKEKEKMVTWSDPHFEGGRDTR